MNRLPDSDDLARDPVLAILAALEQTLTLAVRALAATHPHAFDADRADRARTTLTASDRVAPDIIMIARHLTDALESYRNAIVMGQRSPH